MEDEIPKLKQMMKDLTDLKDRAKSEAMKGTINSIVMDIKQLIEFLDY